MATHAVDARFVAAGKVISPPIVRQCRQYRRIPVAAGIQPILPSDQLTRHTVQGVWDLVKGRGEQRPKPTLVCLSNPGTNME
ncbi:hypothetical protein CGCF415_v013958 [Colletotrichum fructicola]|nr:hypothetical protein CGCFRS4_v015673 [Colletotrichum fructicola]KAF4889834.1 hypothetical protein CGCF415_v013958 [Colletotrichum fructicola]KAF4934731.1 hypothetical protein CGCF245_v008332 [Colletotrichum fructicola]